MVWVASLFRQHILDLSHRCACFPGSWLAGENIMVFPRPHRVLLALEVARKSVSTVSHPFRAEQGTSLETPSRTRASSCQAVGTTWFFSSCGARPLSLLQRGLAPRSKGKARAELRPARRQARLPHSRSLLLPGRER